MRQLVKTVAPLIYRLNDFGIQTIENVPMVPKNSNPKFFTDLVLVLPENVLPIREIVKNIKLTMPLFGEIKNYINEPDKPYLIWAHRGDFYRGIDLNYILLEKEKLDRQRFLTFRELLYAYLCYGEVYLGSIAAESRWSKSFIPYLVWKEDDLEFVAHNIEGTSVFNGNIPTCLK